jgi:hypothetical protein
MDQPFITSGLFVGAFVFCLVAVGVGALWPMAPAITCTVVGSLLLGASSLAKPVLAQRLIAQLPVGVEGRFLEVASERDGLLRVAAAHRSGLTVGIDTEAAEMRGTQILVAEPAALPLATGSFQAAVGFLLGNRMSEGDIQMVLKEMTRVLRPGGGIGLVERHSVDTYVAQLRAAGMELTTARTWLVWPPAQVILATAPAAVANRH